jgi:hypothetical protein
VDASATPTPLEELKERTTDLFSVLRSAQVLGGDAAAVIERLASEVETRLGRDERTILVVGESADRRAIFDALLGEPALARAQREPTTMTRLRFGATFDYEAKLQGGATERFQHSVPEREDAFARAIARAERDRATAEEEAREIAVEAEERRADTLQMEAKTTARQIAMLWSWLLAWLFGLFNRDARPERLSLGAATLEGRAQDAAARIAKATEHRQKLEVDRASYAAERRRSFFAALRALADDLARGGEVTELLIVFPSSALPSGTTLAIAPDLRSYGTIDGCLLVTAGGRPPPPQFVGAVEALGELAARSIAPGASASEIRRVIEGLRRAIPVAVSEKALALARASIEHAVEDGARAEAVCNERIAALEGQRLADPAEFRARSMARMGKAIDDGARDVVRAAIERLPGRVEAIKAEWRASILGCTDRKLVEARVRSIRDAAPSRIGALVDETNEVVIAEMQRVSDTMQLWLLEEIHARYQVARRASSGEGAAPVIAEASSGEHPGLEGVRIDDAMDAFEQKRVGYGLGGAAAGAVLGTLIAPVIGTAIGAFLGVFAGLLTGVESLAQDCAAKISACVDDSAEQIRAQLEARHASLVEALRASLEDALDGAMQRFARSIARLMALEQKTLASERTKLGRLADLRAALEVHEARLTTLAAQARLPMPPG